MEFPELYRRTFAQVHTSVKVDLEEIKMAKRSGTIRLCAIIAVVVAVLLVLAVTAYATDWFGQRDYAIKDHTGLEVDKSYETDDPIG